LESKLNAAKRKVLENFGKVYAPDLNYSVNRVQPEAILRALPEVEINVVMGSSMGALNAWYASELLGRPALLFNPPLGRYHYTQASPGYEQKYARASSFKQLLLGGSDEVVDPVETLNFLSQNLREHERGISCELLLGNAIPLQVF